MFRKVFLMLALLLPCILSAGAISDLVITSNIRDARALAILCQRVTKLPVIILPEPWSPETNAFICLPDGKAPQVFPAGKLAVFVSKINPETILILGRNIVPPEATALLRGKNVNTDISLNTWENNAMALSNYFNKPAIEREYRAWKKRCDTIPDPVRK